MRHCPLKCKECPLKLPLSIWQSRSLVRDQAAKATNGQKNGSVEESRLGLSLIVISEVEVLTILDCELLLF